MHIPHHSERRWIQPQFLLIGRTVVEQSRKHARILPDGQDGDIRNDPGRHYLDRRTCFLQEHDHPNADGPQRSRLYQGLCVLPMYLPHYTEPAELAPYTRRICVLQLYWTGIRRYPQRSQHHGKHELRRMQLPHGTKHRPLQRDVLIRQRDSVQQGWKDPHLVSPRKGRYDIRHPFRCHHRRGLFLLQTHRTNLCDHTEYRSNHR